MTDAEGKTTSYTYNGFNDLLSVSSPDTGVTTYTVDEAGNRLSQTDARSVTVNYSYDALNRRISESFSDSTLDIQYTYDQGAYGEGRLTGISDASGSTDYGYGARGNLTDVNTTINGQSYSQSYSYNGANRLTDMTYPSGRTVTYTYDNSGRVDQINSGNETLADSFTRLPFGPTTGLTLGNGIHQSRSYDLDYRVLSITDDSVLSRNYGFNTVDNITAITDSLIPAASQLFTYDDLDRLDFAAGDYGDKSYSYDGIGNRQSRVTELGGTTQTQAYSYATNSHRLASVTNGPSFQYDASGNTIAKGSTGFAYDDRNRLSSAVVNGATVTYTHNALGQRVRKSGSIGDTHYVYDREGRLVMEADGSGTVVAEYSYLDGEPLTMWRDSTTPTASSVLQNGGFESGLNHWISCSNSGAWIGTKKAPRFMIKDGARQPNPEWRPFVATVSKSAFKKGQFPDRTEHASTNGAIKELVAIVGSFFQYLQIEEYCLSNPVALIRQKSKYVQKRQGHSSVRRLSEPQWQTVLDTAEQLAEENPGIHERTLFMICALFSMYLRISELAASDRWTPTMSDFQKDHEGRWWFTTVGKGNKERQIAVSDTMLAALRRWRRFQGLSALPSPADKSPLFPVHRGKGPLSNTTHIRNIVQVCFDRTIECLNEQGLKEEAETMMDSTVHWLRHTGISEDVKIRPREHVRDDAGHSSSAITDRHIDIELTEGHRSAKRKKIRSD